MHTISKLAALAVLAAGTGMLAAAAPSQAQAERQPALSEQNAAPITQLCCTPAQRPIITNASGAWTVQPPAGPSVNAVVVTNPNPGWKPPQSGAQWISNVATSGMGSHPGGAYVYTTTFCLCTVPKGIQPFPAAMYLSILSDNSFVAKLNNIQFATGGPTSFTAPTNVNVPAADFVAGLNVLQITVTNQSGSPTGLAVSGWIAAYFQSISPLVRCRRA